MHSIVICDDDKKFGQKLLSEVRTILTQTNRQAKIHLFTALEEIPKQTLQDCDIAFLDIDFTRENYTGIDIARRLRSLNESAVIIFVTNFPEYAPEGYAVHAFRDLLKSELSKKLASYLQQAFEHLPKVKQVFQIATAGDVITVPVSDILYMESHLHQVIVHIQKTGAKDIIQKRFYASLTKLEEELESKGFLRIHKSFLVNMQHIQKYQCSEVQLTCGVCLPSSERNYAEQKKKYLLWKGRQ